MFSAEAPRESDARCPGDATASPARSTLLCRRDAFRLPLPGVTVVPPPPPLCLPAATKRGDDRSGDVPSLGGGVGAPCDSAGDARGLPSPAPGALPAASTANAPPPPLAAEEAAAGSGGGQAGDVSAREQTGAANGDGGSASIRSGTGRMGGGGGRFGGGGGTDLAPTTLPSPSGPSSSSPANPLHDKASRCVDAVLTGPLATDSGPLTLPTAGAGVTSWPLRVGSNPDRAAPPCSGGRDDTGTGAVRDALPLPPPVSGGVADSAGASSVETGVVLPLLPVRLTGVEGAVPVPVPTQLVPPLASWIAALAPAGDEPGDATNGMRVTPSVGDSVPAAPTVGNDIIASLEGATGTTTTGRMGMGTGTGVRSRRRRRAGSHRHRTHDAPACWSRPRQVAAGGSAGAAGGAGASSRDTASMLLISSATKRLRNR